MSRPTQDWRGWALFPDTGLNCRPMRHSCTLRKEATELLPSAATSSPQSCEPDLWLLSKFADGMFATSSLCFVFETPS